MQLIQESAHLRQLPVVMSHYLHLESDSHLA